MKESSGRPDPDALLEHVVAEEERGARAKLKIFFGFAPGVGKTYAMLESSRRLLADGIDVVVGCVETHGRPETAGLAAGLPELPRRRVEYRGVSLEELDLDAALARRPAVLLVDELAHTNAPGSRHVKRWQDVQELLDAGIDVDTTLNVQHVESLNDVVAQVTGVRVRETVPDSVLDRADEIELIDLPPDELLERLQEGKVYIPEQARHAANNFFQKGNLHALREMALRRTAEHVDEDVRAYRTTHSIGRTWATAERLLVCVGPGSQSARLVRSARRLAGGLRAPWTAVHVEVTTRNPLSESDQMQLDAQLRLAESLGADAVRLSGSSVAEAVLDFARKHNVTRILVGKPRHGRWRDLLRGSVLDALVRKSGDIDIQVLGGEKPSEPPRPFVGPSEPFDWKAYARGAFLVAISTALSALGFGLLDLPDVVMIYLLANMIVAVRYGRGASIFTAALSVLSFDFFFVPPAFTFSVSDMRYVLTFGVMFTVAVVLSTLATRLRFQEASARTREERTRALLDLSRDLGAAVDEREVAQATCRRVQTVFGRKNVILLPDESGALVPFAESEPVPLGTQEMAVAHWAYDLGQSAGHGTETLPGSRISCLPFLAGGRTFGVLAVLAEESTPTLASAERDHLEAFVQLAALTFERARFADEAKAAALRARTEELRSSLLSTVSHDLRTPLAAITGAASTLRASEARLSREERTDLLTSIGDEAERLERLVSNLLDMTRVDAGGLEMHREWVPIEEIVGSALSRLEKKLADRKVAMNLPETLPLVSVDPLLFEQVLFNLLENAVKHTPEGTPIEIAARSTVGDPKAVELEVSDRGPGFGDESPPRLFEKFARGSNAASSGVGLGLAICRGVVVAHGGTISAENRAGGGATFRIVLPLPEEPPGVADAEMEAREGEPRAT